MARANWSRAVQDAFALIDSGGVCVFFAVRYVFTKEVHDLACPPGQAAQPDHRRGLQRRRSHAAAERVYNLERLFMLKAGSTERYPAAAHAQRTAARRSRQGTRG